MSTRVPLIFGTMTLGSEGKNGVRTSSIPESQGILDVFFKHGHTELDTARLYGEGTTEISLSELKLGDASIDTKVYPVNPGDHSPRTLRATFFASLAALNRSKVRVLYLHAPDRSVPFEETCEEMDKMFKEGLFEIFGLSNFASWEVAEIVGICKARGYNAPKIYQAMYNAITREIEPELVPCLRKFGIRLVIYNPLAGGFFAGKVNAQGYEGDKGGRFDPGTDKGMQKMYRARYLNEGYFKALEILKEVTAKHNLRLTETALRWTQHHSVLTSQDGVILGASTAKQLEENCVDCTKGPLDGEVVKALDEAYETVKRAGGVPLYWR